MLSDRTIIQLLRDYGHLGPSAATVAELSEAANVTDADLDKLTLDDVAVKQAIASFQGYMPFDMERLSLEHRKAPSGMLDSGTVAAFGDGAVDDAVRALFEVPRCGMPDIMESGFGASGSWALPCRTEGVTFYVDPTNMPTTYAPVWDSEILPEVIDAYRRVGARMKQITDRNAANIFNSFPALAGSTIGLATLHAGGCGSKGFCRLDRSFRCNKEQAKELLCHEWGHNWNHNHTRGGIMAPSIGSVPKFKGWEGDPAMSAWVRFTGGQPLPPINRPVGPDDFNTAL